MGEGAGKIGPMVFSSLTFLFFYLPVVLLLYHLLFLPVSRHSPRAPLFLRLSNLLLLGVSILFYFWGEGWLVWILLTSTMIDYVCGLLISGAWRTGRMEPLTAGGPRSRAQRLTLIASLTANLLFLGFFKYFNFGLDTVNHLLPDAWRLTDTLRVTLPLGISFYTFQSMSYTIDVYRGHVKATRNLIDFACYVALFPQLVAGPIVRYADIAQQLVHRTVSTRLFASGVNRFVLGLAKKVLIANTVARSADAILALPADQITTPQAWAATLCYSIQIYYDFSGYSDMAIGLGRMFGFHFLENFDYPYMSRSIQEFWRRWHISLSTWFRDYLYIPLGGNRKGESRTYLNLIAVFFLCGLWHGANWSYVAWGLFHGFFLILERLGLAQLTNRLPRLLQHGYALLVIMVGWVLFFTESLSKSVVLMTSMAGFAPTAKSSLMLQDWWSGDILAALVFGILFSAPVLPRARLWCQRLFMRNPAGAAAYTLVNAVAVTFLFLFSAMSLAAGTHNPFIYFRF
jgi:alginate O-acetyltransferase complex protein AlgI